MRAVTRQSMLRTSSPADIVAELFKIQTAAMHVRCPPSEEQAVHRLGVHEREAACFELQCYE